MNDEPMKKYRIKYLKNFDLVLFLFQFDLIFFFYSIRNFQEPYIFVHEILEFRLWLCLLLSYFKYFVQVNNVYIVA